MTRTQRYLTIPEAYGQWLGDLRWSENLEAIEYRSRGREVGCTFAMSEEVGLFLEGFRTREELVPFGCVLHFLDLLGLGIKDPFLRNRNHHLDIVREFHIQGRPLRNAGALFAYLTRQLARASDPPVSRELFDELRRKLRSSNDGLASQQGGEVPPLEPSAFEDLLLKALAQLTPDQLRHWLKHGCDSQEEPSEAQLPKLPRSLREAFEKLAEEPRLVAALSLVETLEGMLTLPSRVLQRATLPTGGYTDLSTRGHPERILPSQLVLDGDEFIRRYSENELLFFEREAPQTPQSHGVVVLLDQGVRTWGHVRLILLAALLSLGRRAERSGIGFQVAVTSDDSPIWDPCRIESEKLAQRLGASDLTLNPGKSLRSVLDSVGDRNSDVVLLTHPRSLASPEVVTAAQAASNETRLFAVTADDEGTLSLSEIRQGIPIPRTHCRVALPDNRRTPRLQEVNAIARPQVQWKGDVEYPNFPFRLPLRAGVIDDRLFDLDRLGDRLLIAESNGLIRTWNCDGSKAEILPRALVQGKPLALIVGVVGVLGGFVITGYQNHESVAVHYDFRRYTCNIHELGKLKPEQIEWSYLPDFHSLILQDHHDALFAIDLGVDPSIARFPPQNETTGESSRAAQAWFRARGGQIRLSDTEQGEPRTWVPPASPRRSVSGPSIELDANTGTVQIENEQGLRKAYQPREDGVLTFIEGKILQKRCSGDIFGVVVGTSYERRLILFSKNNLKLLLNLPIEPDCKGFALQRNGRRFARRVGTDRIEVHSIQSKGPTYFVTPSAQPARLPTILLGETSLIIRQAKHSHTIRWDAGRLRLIPLPGVDEQTSQQLSLDRAEDHVTAGVRRDKLPYDQTRYPTGCRMGKLTALVDVFGHVCLFDEGAEFLCMFAVLDSEISAWMYDGTRFGPHGMIGGPPSSNAFERIGEALYRASSGEMRYP